MDSRVLTGELREFLQLRFPLRIDLDQVLLAFGVLIDEPQLLALQDHLLRLLRVLGGQYGEEVPTG